MTVCEKKSREEEEYTVMTFSIINVFVELCINWRPTEFGVVPRLRRRTSNEYIFYYSNNE